jgi:hypothetical protein
LGIRERIYLNYKRLRTKSNRFTLPHSLTNAKNFLVCLPRRGEEISCVSRRLEVLTDLFGKALFSFSCDSALAGSLSDSRGNHRILMLDPDSLGFFSNPKGAFLRRLLALNAQVAIDLDFDGDLTNALICLESRATLRLGAERKNLGLPFYNLVIASGKRRDVYSAALDSFLETLTGLVRQRAPEEG